MAAEAAQVPQLEGEIRGFGARCQLSNQWVSRNSGAISRKRCSVTPSDVRAIAPSCHNPEQFGAKLIRGGGQHSFGLDAALARGAEAKEVHHDVSDDGKVVGGEAGAHGGLVFVELHVEAPVESVLHFPMAAHRMSNALGVSRQRTDVVASLATGLGADASFSLDDREALQIQPLLGFMETIHGIERPAAAHFGAPVAAVGGLVQGTRRQRAPHAGLGEHNGVDELGVVVLDAQHMVSTAFADLPRDVCLGTHRVDRDHATAPAALDSLGIPFCSEAVI